MSMNFPTLLVALAASVLAACETPPPAAPKSEPPPSASSAPRAVEPPALPAPAVTPPAAPTGPVAPAAQQQAQKIALAAAEMLESGNEEPARGELKRALGVDPQNKLALNLSRQMAADPVATLGRESFAYTVRPSDTMSRIAQRFLGDVYAFYILARYNDIKVPKQVSSGQVIRVPGKAPPPGAAPAAERTAPAVTPHPAAAPPSIESVLRTPQVAPPQPPPEPTPGERAMRAAAAAERAADLPQARVEYLNAASLNQPGAAAKAEQLRTQLVTRYSVNARNALARQDLDGAIGNWQRVIDLDADNATARLELERVRRLKEKLKNVK